jgi:hypothetical protein
MRVREKEREIKREREREREGARERERDREREQGDKWEKIHRHGIQGVIRRRELVGLEAR